MFRERSRLVWATMKNRTPSRMKNAATTRRHVLDLVTLVNKYIKVL